MPILREPVFFLNLEDTIQAMKDYAQAIALTPEDDRLYKTQEHKCITSKANTIWPTMIIER